MLVLTRKVDEVVAIGEDVTVRILKVQGDRVRIGIEAPDEVAVHRQEVLRRREPTERPTPVQV